MKVTPTALAGVALVDPQVHGDARGFFLESFHAGRYAAAGVAGPFVQDNVSRSRHGVLRGLHLQHPYAQGKLVSVLEGEVFDVAVDVRVGSPTFGCWVGEYLSAENHRQLYVPAGFAHGFVVTSESALFSYKCTDYYHPETERAVRWDDPQIGVAWPVDAPTVSPRDQAGLALAAFAEADLPRYAGDA